MHKFKASHGISVFILLHNLITHEPLYIKRAWISALHFWEGISPSSAMSHITHPICWPVSEGSRQATQGRCCFDLTETTQVSGYREVDSHTEVKPLSPCLSCALSLDYNMSLNSCPSIQAPSSLNHLICWGFRVSTSLESWGLYMLRPLCLPGFLTLCCD